jgi:hypothetical protein
MSRSNALELELTCALPTASPTESLSRHFNGPFTTPASTLQSSRLRSDGVARIRQRGDAVGDRERQAVLIETLVRKGVVVVSRPARPSQAMCDMGFPAEWAYTRIPALFHRCDGFRNGFVRPVRARLWAQCCRSSRNGNKRAIAVFARVKPRSKSTGALGLSFHRIEHESVTSDASVYARGGPRELPFGRQATGHVCGGGSRAALACLRRI